MTYSQFHGKVNLVSQFGPHFTTLQSFSPCRVNEEGKNRKIIHDLLESARNSRYFPLFSEVKIGGRNIRIFSPEMLAHQSKLAGVPHWIACDDEHGRSFLWIDHPQCFGNGIVFDRQKAWDERTRMFNKAPLWKWYVIPAISRYEATVHLQLGLFQKSPPEENSYKYRQISPAEFLFTDNQYKDVEDYYGLRRVLECSNPLNGQEAPDFKRLAI